MKLKMEHKEEIIRFLQKLIQLPSVEGLETKVCQLIEKQLAKYGILGKYKGLDKERLNFIAKIQGRKEGKVLMFNGHTDVVPSGDESRWKYPPFSGKLVGNKLYGRGSADMKAGIASIVLAAVILKESKVKLNGDIILSFTANEENPQEKESGIQYLLKKNLIKADACIIAEPKSGSINIGSRGVYRFSIKTRGKSAHTGRTRPVGTNAILRMAKLLLALDKYKLDYISHKHFPPPKISAGTVISGGTAVNIVPDECKALVDIRLSFGQTRETVEKDLRLLFQKIKTKEIFYAPPAAIDEKSEIVSLLQENAKKILGFTPNLKVAGPAGDNNFLIDKGIPTATFGPEGENFHSENEFVYLDSIFKIAQIFAKTAMDYLV